MDPSKALNRVSIEASLLDWMTIHGNLCLALRHPQNTGDSRAVLIAMVHRIGKMLVKGGMLTQAELDYATQVEQDQHGMERFV